VYKYAKNNKRKKFRWIKLILDKEIAIENIVKVCPSSERSLKYCLDNFKNMK